MAKTTDGKKKERLPKPPSGKGKRASTLVSHAENGDELDVNTPAPSRPALNAAHSHDSSSENEKGQFSTAGDFRPAQPFEPPTGFGAQALPSSVSISEHFTPEELEGKQIFYLSVPANVSLNELKTVSWKDVQNEQEVLNFQDGSYGLNIDDDNERKGLRIMLPTKDGYSVVHRKVDMVLHMHQMAKLTDKRAAPDAEQQPGPSKRARVRDQPQGLRMRFKPMGFGDGDPGDLGESSDDDFMDVDHQTLMQEHGDVKNVPLVPDAGKSERRREKDKDRERRKKKKEKSRDKHREKTKEPAADGSQEHRIKREVSPEDVPMLHPDDADDAKPQQHSDDERGEEREKSRKDKDKKKRKHREGTHVKGEGEDDESSALKDSHRKHKSKDKKKHKHREKDTPIPLVTETSQVKLEPSG